MSNDYHLKAILQQIPQPSINNVSYKITFFLNFYSNLPGANVLINQKQEPIRDSYGFLPQHNELTCDKRHPNNPDKAKWYNSDLSF